MKGGPLEEVKQCPEAGKQARKLASQKLKASGRSEGGGGAAPAGVLGIMWPHFADLVCAVSQKRELAHSALAEPSARH